MSEARIEPIRKSDLGPIRELSEREWGSSDIVTRGRRHHLLECAGLVARLEGRLAGFLCWHSGPDEMEIVALMAVIRGHGIGSTLVSAALDSARALGARRVWLITTNDNTRALRFYQRLGFRLAALHRDAVDAARSIKPEIPVTSSDGIPIRDEIELEIILT